MANNEQQTRFVIFAGEQTGDGQGNRYVDPHGALTALRARAAKFQSAAAAKAFAARHQLLLGEEFRIGREYFVGFELRE